MNPAPRPRRIGYLSDEASGPALGNARLQFALRLSNEVYKFICRNPDTLLTNGPAAGDAGRTLVDHCGLPRFVFAYLAQVYSSQPLLDKVRSLVAVVWGSRGVGNCTRHAPPPVLIRWNTWGPG